MAKLAGLLLVALLLAACASGGAVRQGVDLTGAGATFPFPLYSRWFDEYQRVEPGVRINYQSIGSGGGIRQFIARTVDFGASDVPMTADERAQARGEVVQVPTVIGAVALAYNLPRMTRPLRLDGPALAAIFLGEVTRWNDAKIAALNPGVALPAQPIAVVHRADSSGTTGIFTRYLAAVSPAWRSRVGVGKAVKWPTGIGAKGNEGVAGQIANTPAALGYVELTYARQTKMQVAALRNAAGAFVDPTLEAVSAAAAGLREITGSIVNATGADTYPIASPTYILLYREQPDAAKGRALVRFLWWAVHDGQQFASPLDYAPLPAPLVARIEGVLRTVTAGGRPLLEAP